MRRFGKKKNAKRLSVGETGAGGYHKPSATSRMSDIATLIVVAALADNIVLSKMLGFVLLSGLPNNQQSRRCRCCDNGGINGGGSGGLCG